MSVYAFTKLIYNRFGKAVAVMLCLSNHIETVAFWHIEIPLEDIWVFRPEISEGMAPQDDKRKETEPRWWSAVRRVHEGTLGEETRWIREETQENQTNDVD